MTETLDCDNARISLGVYALNSLDPAERSAVDTHLSACPECRTELADLDGLPSLLGMINAEAAARLTAQDSALPSLRSVVPPPRSADPDRSNVNPKSLTAARNKRSRRRKLRIAVASAAAAVLIVLASLGGALFASHQPQTGQTLNTGTALGRGELRAASARPGCTPA